MVEVRWELLVSATADVVRTKPSPNVDLDRA